MSTTTDTLDDLLAAARAEAEQARSDAATLLQRATAGDPKVTVAKVVEAEARERIAVARLVALEKEVAERDAQQAAAEIEAERDAVRAAIASVTGGTRRAEVEARLDAVRAAVSDFIDAAVAANDELWDLTADAEILGLPSDRTHAGVPAARPAPLSDLLTVVSDAATGTSITRSGAWLPFIDLVQVARAHRS